MNHSERVICAQPLSRDAFAEFGEVIDTDWPNHFPINNGKCVRYDALATVDTVGAEALAVISIFRSNPYDLPYQLEMVERHPLGSQAFVPLTPRPFLVIVCPDEGGEPGEPRAFLTAPGQGVNYFRNTWHGVVTPIKAPQDFLVVDRRGPGNNLEEYRFEVPYTVRVAQDLAV